MNKEQVYDKIINPLMAQILETCAKHGIAMLASFSIPTSESPGLCCTSCLPDENNKSAFGHLQCLQILQAPTQGDPMHLRTEHGDGRVTFTTIA
jgi:hypothetical protein